MQHSTLVSVLMTSYNREKYISEAIESVLHSTYHNFELIIVDDLSRDGTVSIARAYEKMDSRIRVYVNKKNIGDYPNRNLAAEYAKGKYLKYVDCDDKIDSECLTTMVNAMEQYPDAALGLCKSKSVMIQKLFPLEVYKDQSILEHFGPTGSIILKEKFYEIGRFKELVTVSDWDMWYRMSARWPVVSFPDNLVLWRDHAENTLKSDSHRYGVLRNYLKTKFGVLNSIHCPLPRTETRSRLVRETKNIFKYSLGSSINRKNPKFFLVFIQHNWIFLLKAFKMSIFKS